MGISLIFRVTMCDCISGMWDDFVDLGRNIIGCICCMMCIGPILILIGIIVLISAIKDSRGDKIKQYNAAVDKWTASARAEFAAAQFVNNGASPPETLGTVTTGDILKDDDKDIKSYQALKYQSTTGFGAYASGTVGTVGVQYTSDIAASQDNGSPSSIAVTLPFSSYRSTGTTGLSKSCTNSPTTTSSGSSDNRPLCSSVCAEDGGTWDANANTCHFYRVASRFCLKVALSGSTWAATATPGAGIGCLYKTQAGIKGDWGIATTQQSSPGTTVDPSRVNIMIRSSADPYILASELTKGTYDFGLSRAQKIVIGIILIVIGVVISCCVFGAIFYFVKFVIGDGGSGRSFGRSNNNNNTGKSFGNNNGPGVSSYHTPAPAQPVAAQPVAAQPVAAQPVAAQPVAAQPVAAAPVTAYGAPPPGNPYGAAPAPSYNAAVSAPPPAYGGPPPSNPYVAAPAKGANPYAAPPPASAPPPAYGGPPPPQY